MGSGKCIPRMDEGEKLLCFRNIGSDGIACTSAEVVVDDLTDDELLRYLARAKSETGWR